MSDIKCIVCDLDETLLNDEGTIDYQTIDLLTRVQKNGILLVLASARSYKRMLQFADQLKMASYNGLLIDVNGTSIVKVRSKERIRLAALEEEQFKELYHYFKDKNVEIQFNLDDTIYIYLPEEIYELKKKIRGEMKLPEDYPWTGGSFGWFADMRDGYPYSYLINDIADVPNQINKMTLNQEKEVLNPLIQQIKAKQTLLGYSLVKTSDRTVSITKENVTKGNALKAIMQEWSISSDEIVVFGNAENDLSLFDCTRRYAFAVDNASDYVKQQAHFVTDSNNKRGVYHALKKLLFF